MGITVVMIFCIGWAACTVERRLVAAAGHSLVQAATDAAGKLELIIAERRGDIEVLASTPVVRSPNVEALGAYLHQSLASHRAYEWIAVAGASGRLIAATDSSTVGQRRDQEAWFRGAALSSGVTVLSTNPNDDAHQSVAIALSAPIRRSDGRFHGVVAASLAVPALLDALDQTMRVLQGMEWSDDSHIEYQLVNGDGDLMADSDLRQDGALNLKRLGLPSAQLVAATSRGFVEETHLRRHEPVITAYAQVNIPNTSPPLRWGILIRVDRGSVLAPVRAFLRKLMWIMMLLVLPLCGLLLWLVKTLHREWNLASKESRRAAEAESTLVKRTEALHSLVVAATMLSRDRNLDELLHHLLDITRLNTRADYAAFWVPGNGIRGKSTSLETGHEELTRLIARVRAEKGTGAWLVPEQGTIRLADLLAPPGFTASQPHSLSSFLGVPIRCHGRLFGELHLANKRLEDGRALEFTDLDEQVAQTLATQAGIAIENLLLLEESTQRSRLDGMTGLLNHSAALDALSRELARAEREGQPLAVIMADLDHFKRINDTYGHAIGDSVIRDTAGRLLEATRLYDLVGRMGGEEFLVIIPACDLASVGEFAERLRSAISDRPIETSAGSLTVTVSIGATAWSPGVPVSPHSLLETADQALYRVKHRSRNAVEVSTPTDPSPDRQVA